MTPVPVTRADDPRIAPYCMLRERDLVGRDGMFIAEGEVVLRLLVQSDLMETMSVLIAEKRVFGLAEILSNLPQHVPIYSASQEVMDSIVGFHIHRGILALGRRRKQPHAEALLAALPERALVLGLVGIANHDNMGGLFRNAAAFGVDAVIADASCCDPLYRKSIRVSVGAALKVPFAQLEGSDNMIEVLQRHHFTPLALTPLGETPLAQLSRPNRACVLMGAEGPGLPSQIMANCQSVSIPMAHGFDSLNVATASGIVLHHLACVA